MKKLPSSWCHRRTDDRSERSRKKRNTCWLGKYKKIFGGKGGSWGSKKLETSVYHSNKVVVHWAAMTTPSKQIQKKYILCYVKDVHCWSNPHRDVMEITPTVCLSLFSCMTSRNLSLMLPSWVSTNLVGELSCIARDSSKCLNSFWSLWIFSSFCFISSAKKN